MIDVYEIKILHFFSKRKPLFSSSFPPNFFLFRQLYSFIIFDDEKKALQMRISSLLSSSHIEKMIFLVAELKYKQFAI